MSRIVFNRNYLIICGLLVLANVCQGSHSSIRVDNGYKGVVIALSPEISSNHNDILQKTKDLIIAASKALFDATGYLSFQEVTIVVPNGWTDVETDNVDAHRYSDADIIVVDRETSVQSFSMQFGGCGRHALPIVLTKQLVLGATDDQLISDARLLVHEWAHYRYGVFNEFGYPSDPLYPPFYSIPGNPYSEEILPNACTGDHKTFNYDSVDLEYSPGHHCTPSTSNSTGMPDSVEALRCFPIPVPNNSFESSLMYSHSVANVTKFCSTAKSSQDVHTHNAVAPNKQNILCDGRDVMSVIKEHPDFKDFSHNSGKLTKTSGSPETTTFKVWRDTTPRTLFAIHTSEALNTNGRYKMVIMALTKFGMDLPDSEVALFYYNQGEATYKKNWDRPDQNYQLYPKDKPQPIDFIKVLSESHQFFSDGKGGIFVIFISGKEIVNSNSEPGVIQEAYKLKEKNIKLKIILYPLFESADIRKQASQLFKTAIDITGGEVFHIREEMEGRVTSMSTANQLFTALNTVVNDHSGGGQIPAYHLISEKFYSASDLASAGQSVKFVFEPDSSLLDSTSNVHIRAYFVQSRFNRDDNDQNLLQPNKVTLTSPNQQDQGSPNYPSSLYAIRGFSKIIDSSDKIKGNWTLTADLQTPGSEDTLMAIAEFVTTSLDQDVLTAECWLNTQVEFDPSQTNAEPMIAYVNLNKRFDGLVSNASVKLVVTYEKSHINVGQVDMLDNGLGDPDITRGDGIYSQYLTNIKNVGYYTISAIITNAAQDTPVTTDFGSTSLSTDQTSKPCCGSKVNGKNRQLEGNFKRIVECGSVYVTQNVQTSLYPPNTVRDLRIGLVDYDNRTVAIKWTSPGGDYTSSQVGLNDAIHSYEIKAFRSNSDNDHDLIDEIRTNFDSGRIADITITGPSVSSPAPAYGSSEQATVQINTEDEGFYYIALRATDSSHRTSRVSNIVMAYIKSNVKIESTTAFAIDVSKSPVGIGGGGRLSLGGLRWWEILAICIGCIVFLLLIIVLSICFICKKRRKSDDTERTIVQPQRRAPEPPTRVSPEIEKSQTILLDNGSFTHSEEKIPNYGVSGGMNGVMNNGMNGGMNGGVNGLQPNNAYDSGSQRDLRELSVNTLSPVQSWDAKDLLSHWGRVQEAKSRHEAPPVLRIEDLESTSSGHRSQSYASSEDDNTAIYTNPNNWRYQDVTARPRYIPNGYTEAIYRNSLDPLRSNTPSDTAVPRYSTINRIPTQNVSQV